MSEYLEETTEESQHFTINSDQEAEWAIQQIKNAEAEKAKWKEFYDSRYKAVCESCDLTIQNMTSVLQTYFGKVPHKQTATQENYTLPSGKLVFKKQEPEYERNDEEVIGWLKSHKATNFIKTAESVDWASLKKTLTVVGETVADENGEIITGIKATERPDIFKVEIRRDK